MKSNLLPYKLGLGVVGLFTLILLVVVMIGAGNYKHDNVLNAEAGNISVKLNDYIDSHQIIPSSLSQAGINQPEGITYTKLSDSSYKFCVNYRSNYNGFSSAQIEQQILNSGQGSATYSYNSNGASALYPSTFYHKGENCLTVNPILYNYNSTNFNTNANDPYAKCNSIVDNNAYSQCINQVDNQINSQPSTTTL